MKRKVFAVIMAAVILVCGSGLADMPEIDYDSLTQEELVKMREAIDSRIQLANTGDVVYEKDGYVIKWIEINEKDGYVFPIMLITNPNTSKINFLVYGIAFNGVQFNVYAEYRIGAGLSTYSGDYIYYVKKSDIEKVGLSLDSIKDVYIHFYVRDENFKTMFDDTFTFAIK